MHTLRSPELLRRESSRLLLVDVQEKLVPTLGPAFHEQTLPACQFLCEGATLLQIPITITEQYPRGLGPTVAVLKGYSQDCHAKKRFSAVECTGWPTAAEVTDDRYQVVVAGIETHVCVMQTVFDLLASGFQTFIAVDAVAARGAIDHQVALDRMSNAGAIITTTESILFEWCETAEASEFKQLSALIKSRGK